MELKIFWTHSSLKELEKIYKYYRERAGNQIAKKLVESIYDETLILKKHPQTGRIEELLKNRKEEFRYLVFKSYKIIYWINYEKNQVEINDVFDARQNPTKIVRYK